jgi:hypothetical protein
MRTSAQTYVIKIKLFVEFTGFGTRFCDSKSTQGHQATTKRCYMSCETPRLKKTAALHCRELNTETEVNSTVCASKHSPLEAPL